MTCDRPQSEATEEVEKSEVENTDVDATGEYCLQDEPSVYSAAEEGGNMFDSLRNDLELRSCLWALEGAVPGGSFHTRGTFCSFVHPGGLMFCVFGSRAPDDLPGEEEEEEEQL